MTPIWFLITIAIVVPLAIVQLYIIERREKNKKIKRLLNMRIDIWSLGSIDFGNYYDNHYLQKNKKKCNLFTNRLDF